jgi:hypothetical protein
MFRLKPSALARICAFAAPLAAVALAAPLAAGASALSVLPTDGQTSAYRLTGDRQTLDGDRTFNMLLTLARKGDLLGVTSTPTPGTPLPGDARILDDGSLLIALGDLAVQLNAISLASTVAAAAPDTISLVTTWNASAPAVVAGTRVKVPVSVIVSDASPAHTALSVQGRVSAPLPTSSGDVQGTVSLDYALAFRNGAFADGHGVIFSDAASLSSGVHSVTNWHLTPQK